VTKRELLEEHFDVVDGDSADEEEAEEEEEEEVAVEKPAKRAKKDAKGGSKGDAKKGREGTTKEPKMYAAKGVDHAAAFRKGDSLESQRAMTLEQRLKGLAAEPSGGRSFGGNKEATFKMRSASLSLSALVPSPCCFFLSLAPRREESRQPLPGRHV